jgi:GNAT superfamily N-acetyltransferase
VERQGITAETVLLLIACERLRPGMESDYDRMERQIAHASATLGCPHPYLALLSDDRREVWWFNTFASIAERDQIAAAYAAPGSFNTAMQRLVGEKKPFVESVTQTLTTFRPELSGLPGLKLAGARFVVVKTGTSERPEAAVFESEDTERYAIAPARSRENAEGIAVQLGPGALILTVQRQWSFPSTEIRVRIATSDDAEAMAQCRLSDPSAGPADPRVAAYFDGRHRPRLALAPPVGFVALAGESVVGYIAGHLTTRYGYQGEVQYLFVALDYRRQGIATTLLTKLVSWFLEHDARRVCVDVNLDSPSAQPFYERLGAVSFKPHWWGWEDIGSVAGEPRG